MVMTAKGFEVYSIDEIDRVPDAIVEMLTGVRRGILVREAFSPEACERLASGLEAIRHNRGKFEPFYVPVPQARHATGDPILSDSDPLVYGSLIFGTPLILATKGNADHYLKNAQWFRDAVERAWAATPGFEERFVEVLRRLAGGRSVEPPRSESGQPFLPLHIKGIEDTGALAIHCGNETHNGALLEILRKHIDIEVGQISYLVLLRKAEAGGELRVYGLNWSTPDGQRVQEANRTSPETIALCESYGYDDVDPDVGDVIVFDGGRYYHRVNEVHGATSRWTGQGFLALSPDHGTIHYWF
jgi:hypothetical protein